MTAVPEAGSGGPDEAAALAAYEAWFDAAHGFMPAAGTTAAEVWARGTGDWRGTWVAAARAGHAAIAAQPQPAPGLAEVTVNGEAVPVAEGTPPLVLDGAGAWPAVAAGAVSQARDIAAKLRDRDAQLRAALAEGRVLHERLAAFAGLAEQLHAEGDRWSAPAHDLAAGFDRGRAKALHEAAARIEQLAGPETGGLIVTEAMLADVLVQFRLTVTGLSIDGELDGFVTNPDGVGRALFDSLKRLAALA